MLSIGMTEIELRYDSDGAESVELSVLFHLIFFPILPAVAIAAAVAVAIRILDSELRISGGVRTNHYRFPNECDVV